MKHYLVFGSPIEGPLHAVLHVPMDLLSPIPVHFGERVFLFDV